MFIVICEVELAAVDDWVLVDFVTVDRFVNFLGSFKFIFVILSSVRDNEFKVEVVRINAGEYGLW